MATVYRTASKVAWPTRKQAVFGSPLEKTDLAKFLKLQDPLVINENAEHWTDRGAIGKGHDWETQRGKVRQFVRFEIPVQPLPVDFIGYLLALFFSRESASTNGSGAYEHTAKFNSLADRPEAYVTSLAVLEDGEDRCLQDVACTGLTLRGQGTNRLEAGGSFVASKIGDTLSGYSWPAASALRYLYNYAGTFTLDAADRKTQLQDFELSLEAGIDTDLAWRKEASEAERIYPALWPYTPERSMELKISLLAEGGDLAAFRSAQQAGTEQAVVLSCLGESIPGTDPADHDEVEISVPKAVFTAVDYSYGSGLLQLDLSLEGRYDSGLQGPVSIKTTEGSTEEYFAA
ncbi:MAG: hypothetical protein JXQ83_15345 [Candidatus Glassbacteria bacterium]|nr:hypothetical protein [Candidatus Glassbacteria bacterium]